MTNHPLIYWSVNLHFPTIHFSHTMDKGSFSWGFSYPFRSCRLFSNIRVIIVLMSITRSYATRGQKRMGWVEAGVGAGLELGQGRGARQGLERSRQLGPHLCPLLALVSSSHSVPGTAPCLPSPPPPLGLGTGSGRIYGAGPCGEDPGINLSLFRSVIYIYCT